MGLRMLHKENIDLFLPLCTAQELGQILDPTGSFLPGWFALGMEEDGKPRGVLLAEPDKGGKAYTVKVLQYNRKMYPEDGEKLLRGAVEYATIQGAEQICYEYVQQGETINPDQNILRRCGWTTPLLRDTIYCVEQAQQWLADLETLRDDGTPVISFLEVPARVRANFSARFGVDVEPEKNFDLIWEPDPELSLACMDGDELVGYMICTRQDGVLELPACYMKQGRLLVLGTMAKQLSVLCREQKEPIHRIRIHAYAKSGEQLMDRLTAGRVHQKVYRYQSECNLKRRE